MTQIIPAINVENFEEIQKKIKMVEPFSDWAHLDAADGSFTPNITWHNHLDLVKLNTFINIEIHLMVQNPENKLDGLLNQKIKRLIINVETSKKIDYIIEKCAEKKIELGLSVSPQTEIFVLAPYFKKIKFFQILAVLPGRSGQNFDTRSPEKIKRLKAACPNCLIEVDGGITPETAKAAAASGADILASSSYVFLDDNKDNIKNRINALRQAEK